MQNFREFITEQSSKVTFEDEGSYHNDTVLKNQNPIGWFATKMNAAAGWLIFELDSADKKWFAEQKKSTKDVFRIATDKQTNLVKIDFKKAKVLWFDNEKYEKTDKISWEKNWNAILRMRAGSKYGKN